MITENPKALLSKLEKDIAAAKDAFAEIERIERFRKMQEDEKTQILETVDPENRDEMRRLTEINTQLEVIPRRVEKAVSKQVPTVRAVLETSKQIEEVIARLANEEVQKLLDEIEPAFRKWNPEYRDGKGELQKPARDLAGHSTIFRHINLRATVEGRDALSNFGNDNYLNADPKNALKFIQRYAEGQILVLSEYFANGKSFVAPGFVRGEK